MGVIRNQGDTAGEKWNLDFNRDEGGAYWVRAHADEHACLKSSGFGSCVGLVLYGDVAGRGAVAHFWYPAGLAEAQTIVDEYMQWLRQETGGYCGDEVEAVVFGGSEINNDIGGKLTKPRIAAIAEWLENRWDMRVLRVAKGSTEVQLNLKGRGPIEQLVKFDFGLLSNCEHQMSQSPLGKAITGGNASKSTGSTRPRAGSH